jgi:hypothetical protein
MNELGHQRMKERLHVRVASRSPLRRALQEAQSRKSRAERGRDVLTATIAVKDYTSPGRRRRAAVSSTLQVKLESRRRARRHERTRREH